jgi:CubicO group peptidase (beta-lactamase class C family)
MSLNLRLLRAASACAPCFILTACGALSQNQLDTDDAGARRYAATGNLQMEVDSLAQPIIDSGETPGLIVGVLSPNGAMQFFGYGVSAQGTNSKPDGDTVFATGSLSKGFLGDLTAVLVAEGALSWDDTLGKLLPPDAPLSADAKKITLQQLATHTSGLPLQPVTFQTLRYFVQYLFTGTNFYRHLDGAYVLDYLSDFKAPSEPICRYSNVGYGLLGYVIERRTGKTLDVLMEQKLLRPLGLTNTGYVVGDLPGKANRALGHVGDQPKFIARGTRVPDWEFPDLMRGSAGVYSSARDLLTLAAAHLRGKETKFGGALADNLRVRMPRPMDAPAVAWFVDTINGQQLTYQVGMVGGFAGYLGMDVERRTAVVVLQNSFNWTDRIGHRLLIRMAHASPSSGPVALR